jgi:hypothetical protein
MKALIEEGQGGIGKEIQELALKEGALIRHLLNALFVQTSDPRLLTLRQLSRHLIVLWTSQNNAAAELLRRIFVSQNNIIYTVFEYVNEKRFVKLADRAAPVFGVYGEG